MVFYFAQKAVCNNPKNNKRRNLYKTWRARHSYMPMEIRRYLVYTQREGEECTIYASFIYRNSPDTCQNIYKKNIPPLQVKLQFLQEKSQRGRGRGGNNYRTRSRFKRLDDDLCRKNHNKNTNTHTCIFAYLYIVSIYFLCILCHQLLLFLLYFCEFSAAFRLSPLLAAPHTFIASTKLRRHWRQATGQLNFHGFPRCLSIALALPHSLLPLPLALDSLLPLVLC